MDLATPTAVIVHSAPVTTLAADGDFSPTTFGAQLLTAAQGVLPYIGVAVAAGVVVLAAIWGIKIGLRVLKQVGK